MSTSRTRLRRNSLRTLILSAVVAAAFTAASTTASANGGAGGVFLDWTQAAVYDTSAASGYDRTWLGYVTSPTPIGPVPNGTQTPSDGATGDSVTPTSPRGADTKYLARFEPVSGSTSFGNAETAEGEFQFNGTVTWTAPGHNLTVTFNDPKVVLNGDGTGHVYASGTSSSSGAYSDATGPVFDLDLDGQAPDGGADADKPGLQAGWDPAKWVLNSDGSIQLTGLVVKIATPNTTALIPFGGSYGAGVGPDRMPHRFGSMALTLPAQAGPKGPEGPAGPAGPQGAAGPQGPAGKNATIKTIVLKKAAFAKRSRLTAKIYRGKRHIGYAKVIGRKVTATFIGSKLKGRYTLVEIGGKKRKKKVRLG